MESKKNPKVDIGKNSSLYFALGMALMMFLSYSTINYKVYDKSLLNLDKVNMDALDEEEVPITEQVQPPPPPPSTKVTPKKEDTSDQEDVRESTENASTLASKEYGEQNLAYGQSNPNAQEAEDTIGESARSIIGRSKRFN